MLLTFELDMDVEDEHTLVELVGDLEVSSKLCNWPLDGASVTDDVTDDVTVGGASEHLMLRSDALVCGPCEEVLEVASVVRGERVGEERGGVGAGAYWIQDELGEGEPASTEEGAVEVTVNMQRRKTRKMTSVRKWQEVVIAANHVRNLKCRYLKYLKNVSDSLLCYTYCA